MKFETYIYNNCSTQNYIDDVKIKINKNCEDKIKSPAYLAYLEGLGPLYKDDSFSSDFKFLGQGFYGKVYKVHNFFDNISMVFKTSTSNGRLGALNKEIIATKKINHRNVIKFYGTAVIDESYGFLIEFINHGNLFDYIKENGVNISWETVVEIVDGVSSGVTYIHSLFMIHKDLSTMNILLDRTEVDDNKFKLRAVIADFGLAVDKKSAFNSHSDSIRGNPIYVPPEVLSSNASYDYSSDIFSMGLIFCELITGLTNELSNDLNIPRTNNFGLDYANLPVRHDCPKWLQNLSCNCCKTSAEFRPSAVDTLITIKKNKPYISLWNTSRPRDSTPALETAMANMLARNRRMFQTSIESTSPTDQLPKSRLDRKTQRAISVFIQPIFSQNYPTSIPLSAIQRKISCNTYNSSSNSSLMSLAAAHWHHNSLDSFLEPSHLNLTKAHEDPDYSCLPLRSFDKLQRRSPSLILHELNSYIK